MVKVALGVLMLLTCLTVLSIHGIASAAYLEMKDGAKIYYEDQGRGQPIVLIHGWTCSSRFWQENAPELAKEFRVITIDLRGHGNSSKILTGHTISQYARDVREVIEYLGLQGATLAGWSLGGPVVLSYWQQYAGDSRLKALGLIDTAPYPFSPADWNSHSLKNHNVNAMNVMFKIYSADPLRYATSFTANMFKDAKAADYDLEWIPAELTKTPPWIAVAIYSDFLISDYTRVLPTITVPVIVFAANSNIYKSGINMGRNIAALIPRATFVPFEDAGHLLFYEQPEKFNKALGDFVKASK
ncbi:MAG: alpha/beta hydrolase [Negativicutes bacterium]|nr:alpha/beta hydrolase [Negativicutes bacterium]